MVNTQDKNSLSPTDIMLDNWHHRIRRSQVGHFRAAASLERLHFIVGLLSIIISAMIGSSVFTSLQDIASSQPHLAIRITIGVASLSAGILTGIQTFSQFSQRAKEHKIASTRYSSLRQEIEIRRRFGSGDCTDREFVETVNKKWEQIREESPTLPPRILRQMLKEFPNPQT